MSIPFANFEVEFSKDGTVFDQRQIDAVLAGVTPGGAAQAPTDLFVMSHGWNNDMADARNLYGNFFTQVEKVRGGGVVAGIDGRAFAVVGVMWPSKKFADAELIPGGGAAAAESLARPNLDATVALLERLKQDPVRLPAAPGDAPALDPLANSPRRLNLTRAQELAPRLESDPRAREEFVALLRAVLDPSDAHPDDGSEAFFTEHPLQLFQDMADGVIAPGPAGGTGGGASVGAAGVSAGGAAGLRDLFGGIVGAARRIANFVTYYQMKNRAGLVGRGGAAFMVRQIQRANPGLKIHLLGHSFGGRLVTALANALDPAVPATTLTLLQAAFSHNGLAPRFDGRHDGAFRPVIADQRVVGPTIITHTKNDQAVGIAYPLASRIAHDQAAALGDANDPYGGMGRNGAQHTPEVNPAHRQLLDVGEAYTLIPGGIYNLNADRFIKDHSDVCKPEVAQALLSAVALLP